MKSCVTCKVKKIEEDFEKKGIRGYGTVCKTCRNLTRKSNDNVVNVESWKCSSCEILKSVDDFNKCRRTPQGIDHVCKSCKSLKNQALYEKNKDKVKKAAIEYYYANTPKIRKTQLKRQKIRLKEDPMFLLARRLRSRLYDALRSKEWTKSSKLRDFIGCTLEELKSHIEKQFVDGMSWENRELWEIDHHIPCSSAKTPEELYLLNHYTNLRPLWTEANRSKGAKLPDSNS